MVGLLGLASIAQGSGLFSGGSGMGGGGFMGSGSKSSSATAISTGYFTSGEFNPVVGGGGYTPINIGFVVVVLVLIFLVFKR